MGQAESKLEYTEESSEHSLCFKVYADLGVPGQPLPKHPTDIPITVPTPLIDVSFPCCPSCEVLNELVTELVPIEEAHPVVLPANNQGRAVRWQVVCGLQQAFCGLWSDCRGYGGIACMQLSVIPRHEYPDQCD